jgi:hypothetical protein
MVPKHGIEDCQEFPHGSGKGDFPGPTGGHQALVKYADRRIVLDGCERCHVEHTPDVSAAAHDHAAAAKGATVAGDRSQTRQRGNAAAVEPTELGQIGNEGTGGDRADAGDGAQQIVCFSPQGRRTNDAIEILIEATESVLEPGDVGIDVPLQAAIAQQAAPIVLSPEHVDQLTSSSDELAQGVGLLIGHRPGARPYRFGKEGDEARIEGVGFGQLPGRPGEVADLAGIDDGDGDPGGGQGCRHGDFVAAGGLQDNDGGL